MGRIPLPAFPLRSTPTHYSTQKGKGGRLRRPPVRSLLKNEMAAAILLPASFVAFCAEGLFLPVADGLDPAGADASPCQRGFHRTGTLVAQGQVVVGRSALVAMSLNRDVHILMLIEELRVRLQRTLLIAANIRLVVIEVHILDVLAEQVFVRHRWRGRRWRRWCRSHCKPRRSFLRTARSLGNQVIGRRIGRRDALRAVRLHRANPVDRHVSRVARLPCQRRGLPRLNGVGIHRDRSGRLRRWRRWRRWWRSRFFLAGAQHHYGTQHDYECEPFHTSLFHFHSSCDPKACPPRVRRSVFTISNSNSVAYCVP